MLILTIHGLGGSSTTLYPMKKYIEQYYKPKSGERLIVDSFDYASKKSKFEDIISALNDKINKFDWENDSEKCILIGHSLGGVVGVHIQNPRVKDIITISSPINDCKLAKKVNENVPTKVSSFLFGNVYDNLISPPLIKQNDDVKIICITSSSLPSMAFDGRVYVDEMVHPQAHRTYHLEYSGHVSQLLDVRMMRLVYESLMEFEK